MTNEATKVELYGQYNDGSPRRFTCSATTAIIKGALLKFATPRTASLGVTAADFMAGIASMEKSASDGATTISVWTDGIFKLMASEAIVAGNDVQLATNPTGNMIMHAAAASSGAHVLGFALENIAAGSTGEVRVLL